MFCFQLSDIDVDISKEISDDDIDKEYVTSRRVAPRSSKRGVTSLSTASHAKPSSKRKASETSVPFIRLLHLSILMSSRPLTNS
jgi:hypothetical protein